VAVEAIKVFSLSRSDEINDIVSESGADAAKAREF